VDKGASSRESGVPEEVPPQAPNRIHPYLLRTRKPQQPKIGPKVMRFPRE